MGGVLVGGERPRLGDDAGGVRIAVNEREHRRLGVVFVEMGGDVGDPSRDLGRLLREAAAHAEIHRDRVVDAVLHEAVSEDVVVVLPGVKGETREPAVTGGGDDGCLLVEVGFGRRHHREGEIGVTPVECCIESILVDPKTSHSVAVSASPAYRLLFDPDGSIAAFGCGRGWNAHPSTA